jgi:hypothetical protein
MLMFFYGTLTDPDVLDLVMGRRLGRDAFEAATAPGFRRVFIAGRDYPTLLPHPQGWVDGILVRGLSAADIHRLEVFEGAEYTLQPVQVRNASGHTVRAHVFLCAPGIPVERRGWRLDQWQRRHKRAFLHRARLARLPR